MADTVVHQTGPMADNSTSGCYCSSSSDDDSDEGDSDGSHSSSGCSTADAVDWQPLSSTRRRRPSDTATTAAAATEFDLLDARRLPDLLDPDRLVTVLDNCLRSEFVRGCVVETWDTVLSDHLESIAHLVLYQTPEHAVSQTVYEQLTGLSAVLRPPLPPNHRQPQATRQPEPARVDAERVYATLRSAARSLLTTRVDTCCRQSMCRAVGLAVVALRSSTRPVFTVENFLVEINEAANFANLYCTRYARRICAALKDIYDTVMAGDYHPNNVTVQMAVMEKSIQAALSTLVDAQATGEQKAVAQRSLLAELDGICTTVRMKNHGCLDDSPTAAEQLQSRRKQEYAAAVDVRDIGVNAFARRFVHFTMSPWRAPISMYHQKSPVSVDQVLKNTVRLIETLVSELFKPCLSNRHRRRLQRYRSRHNHQLHDKQL
ncbi:Hypothetical protein CINCED_3A012102 [Cinara cedri]|uniref:Uncharacterized protein n=1 Tax=Cinara cedri TaxID=506608 RepID=A0A5E4M2Z0_9HEMI|nr:Hypothetical protein CINCED_3A012102 [Cinara cedri]